MTDKEKLAELKRYRNDYQILKGEIGDWIIERCEKAERYEAVLKEIYGRKNEIYRSIGVLIATTLKEATAE